MKIYVIKGVEGEAGYLKQSMKLPKSWDSKSLSEVLELFVETYNKKYPEGKISASAWHFERPLGSTLFPDDLVSAALSDYCDVFCVEGAVKYKGPPPGTAAALEAKEAKEAEERKAKEPPPDDKWVVKVKCVELDRGGMDVKSQWKAGDVATVGIEPYATIGMLSNRLGLMVGAHPKHQHIFLPDGTELGALDKLKDVSSPSTVLDLVIKVPPQTRVVEDVEPDELFTGPEDQDPPPAFAAECSDSDAQTALKIESDDAAGQGNIDAALDKLQAAVALGGPSATMLCKRGALLLKLGRPKAAELDASSALELNQDSAKAYRLRAKARRKLGLYDQASADFGQAQRIDYDDSIVEEQTYVTNRAKKIRAKQLAEQEAATNDAPQ